MKACASVLEAIGRTPLIRLNRIAAHVRSPIYVKAEFLNPGGSVKDRPARAMIEAAERAGLLKPGGTIIEATAGNTGVGLALVAAVKGYKLIVVMPDKMSEDKMRLLRALGAEVVVTATDVPPDSPDSYNGVAERLAREIPGAFRPNQFANSENPAAHYCTTGPEIWEQTEGQIGVFVAGMGTGGTISGVGRFLKEQNPAIQIVGADPEGSVLSGDQPRRYLVEGIGEDFVPRTFDRPVVDDMIRISDRESFLTARRLAREEGILAGGSSGTAVAAALKYAETMVTPALIVVLLPDTARNYMTKCFSDDWMREHGFWEQPDRPRRTLADVLRLKHMMPELIAVGPRERLRRAVELMHVYNISQLPVIERERAVGSLQEATIMKLLLDGIDASNQEVGAVMGRPLPELDENVEVSAAYRTLLAGSPAILVSRRSVPVGVVTKMDLIDLFILREDAAGKDNFGAGL